MSEATDSANTVIRPPIAWGLAVVAGLAAHWLYPLAFLPASVPAVWLGAIVFGAALALAIWAIQTMRGAGTRIETYRPTTTVVTAGPYRFTRNPIYAAMFLGQIGLAVGFDTLWLVAALVPFYLVIRYGVVAREEAYLERKFGGAFLGYKSQTRRWL
jgi:protein-S-isoprenylcysteine O-methyltransferase Ste14